MCDCGKETAKSDYQLIGTKGRRPEKSCGCREYRYNGKVNKNLRIYHVWYGMKRRCYDINNGSYKRYGAKGIRVSREWLDNFDNFLDWALKNGYKDGLTIDRISSDEGYSPGNCRWVDYYFQNQNKKIFHNNKTGYTGVSYDKKRNKYVASIRRNDLQLNLGSYEDVVSAARAREKAEDYFKENKTLVGYKK